MKLLERSAKFTDDFVKKIKEIPGISGIHRITVRRGSYLTEEEVIKKLDIENNPEIKEKIKIIFDEIDKRR